MEITGAGRTAELLKVGGTARRELPSAGDDRRMVIDRESGAGGQIHRNAGHLRRR